MSIDFNVYHADCLDQLKKLEDNSVDSVVTDPPYGLKFMGKKWDHEVPSVAIWKECLRVLKPGGHMLVACGTRTQHRMAVNIEDAGFEIRDVISWIYGSGFPKSLDISKAIDKEAGAKREVIKEVPHTTGIHRNHSLQRNEWEKKDHSRQGCLKNEMMAITAPATEEAKQWDGWGTALKPACEFWTLARKPLGEKTVAKNVLKHGTGGLNIDGCRVELNGESNPSIARYKSKPQVGNNGWEHANRGANFNPEQAAKGRFPANIILDEEAGEILDEQSGVLYSGGSPKSIKSPKIKNCFGRFDELNCPEGIGNSSGGASRFFYCAKASKKDRGEDNKHPTVKPTKLMEYLCKLITPLNGTVLDPYMGSGSTGVAALRQGFSFTGIERELEYAEMARGRLRREHDELSSSNPEEPYDPNSIRIK